MTARLSMYLGLTAVLAFSFVSPLPADPGSPRHNTPVSTIQVGSFREQQAAQNEALRLKKHGVEAVIRHEAVKDKGMWYRVYVGRFDNESQAREYTRQLKDQGIIGWSWIKTAALPSISSPVSAEPDSKPAMEDVAETAAHPHGNAAPDASGKAPVAAAEEAPIATYANPAPSASKPLLAQAKENKSDPKSLPARQVTARDDRPVFPGEFSFDSQTTLRTFQRDTHEGEDKQVLPLYQYLQLDFSDAEEGGWSVHAYGWGRADLADSGFFEDAADGELLYGYLEYSRPYSTRRLTLGRQHIFAGVTNQSVDGLRLSSGVGEYITASVFGGVTAASEEASTDATYGGRVAIHPAPHYEVALSYQNTQLEGDPDQKTDQRIGADAFFNWSDWLTLQGLSSYNLDSEGWREHRYSASLSYLDFLLEPNYHFFSYRDYFGTGTEENNLFHFLKDTDEQVGIAGADLHWLGTALLQLTARYNHYTYDVRREAAAYYAGLLSLDLSGGSQLGAEVGRMDGETADNTYMLYRVYFYWNNPFSLGESVFISGDGILQNYDEPVFGEERATNYSLSGGMRFLDDTLEVKFTGLYSQDPYFDDDLEGILTLHYKY